jgi:hypothetical protein
MLGVARADDSVSMPVPESWDGPLLPSHGDTGVLLKVTCTAEQEPRWQDVAKKDSLNLREGDRVIALFADGRVKTAKFGSLACELGECHANYIAASLLGLGQVTRELKKRRSTSSNDGRAAKLDGRAAKLRQAGNSPEVTSPSDVYPWLQNRMVAVTSPTFLHKEESVAPVDLRPAADGCKPLPAKLGRIRSTCTQQHFGGESTEILFVRRDPLAEDGSIDYRLFVRGSDTPWAEVAESARPIVPVLAIVNPEGGGRILFYAQIGIGTTFLRVARVLPGGMVDVGRPFTAGTQPCD